MLKPFWLKSGSCGCISRDVLVERPAGTVVIILAGRPGVVVVRNFWGFTTARFTTAS